MRPPRAIAAFLFFFLFGGVAVADHVRGGPSSTPATPLAPSLSTSWYGDVLREFIAAGYLDAAVPLRPNDLALRSEFVELIVTMQRSEVSMTRVSPFDDVAPDHPSAPWFSEASRAGWVRGAGNCLGQRPCFAYPDIPVNRAEAAALVLRAFGLTAGETAPAFRDITPGAWYAEALRTAGSRCILQGDDGVETVRPGATMNRAEMIVMLSRARRRLTYPACGGSVPLLEEPAWTPVMRMEEPQPALTVVLNPQNSVGDVVARGAMGVPVLVADFTASCVGSVTLEAVTLTRGSQGIPTEGVGLWMRVGEGRASRIHQGEDTLRRVTLRFRDPLVLQACATVSVEFLANLPVTALVAGRLSYRIVGASDIAATVTDIDGTFPVRGEVFEIGNEHTGGITVTYRDPPRTIVTVDDRDVVVGGIRVSVDAVEDQTLYDLTLEQQGSARDGDMTAISVEHTNGARLTMRAPQTVAGYVTLHFDPPYTIDKGDTMDFDIHADIVDGGRRSVQYALEESSDLFAVGSRYGFGVNGRLHGSSVDVRGSPGKISIEEKAENGER